MKKLITIDEVAKLHDLSKASVNYYTNLGLIDIYQKKKNKRYYDSEYVAKRIGKIRQMLNEGYTLKLIQKELRKLTDNNP